MSDAIIDACVYRSVFRFCNLLVIALSQDLDIISINDAATKFYHWNPDKVIGRYYWQLYSDKTHPTLLSPNVIKELIRTETGRVTVEAGVEKDKLVIDWEFHTIKSNDNLFFLLLGNDMTELHKAKDKIYEFDSIIAQLPGNVYWYSKDLVYLGCNENSAKTLNMTRTEAVGQDFKQLMGRVKEITKETIEQFIRDGETVIQTGEPLLNIEEPPFIGPDGNWSQWIANKVPLRDKNDQVYAVVGISTDITQLKKLEKKLIDTEAREARFKAMAALGGMIAHELRTPLASLKSSAFGIQKYLPELVKAYEICASEGKIDSIPANRMKLLKESIAHMDCSVGYAQATIRSVLAAFHDTTSFKTTVNKQYLFPEIVNKALDQYIFDIGQEELVTLKHLDDVMVFADDKILIHVVHNLLKNAFYAIKTVNKGSIVMWSKVDDDHLNFYFEDTALGIDSNELRYIFDAFYTTKKKSAGGIGMGLYFCKMALEKIGATITCETSLGQYTRFKITLKLSKNDA